MVVSTPAIVGGRAYSMVNDAGKSDRLNFVIKRKPEGAFSDWLFDGDVLGAELDLFGPLGQATFRPEEHHDLLCITGGSGIAGIMSILRHAVRVSHFSNHKDDCSSACARLLTAFI